MAYRRKRGSSRPSTFEDFRSSFTGDRDDDSPVSTPTSLAAKAIRASSAHRESSLFSASGDPMLQHSVSFTQTPVRHEYTTLRSTNESKYGFWGVLARKAKSILEDDVVSQQFDDCSWNGFQMLHTSEGSQFNQPNLSPEGSRKPENLASSLNHIGGTIKNALEEGLMIVENRTADIIQETKKLQIRRKSISLNPRGQAADFAATKNLPQNISDQENRLKAPREEICSSVLSFNLCLQPANAMAAKPKLLLLELNTLRADLDFAKERCQKLEEENKFLRENREKGDGTADDDLIRLQLETLLAEKGRLAHENSIYARENRFLREIVEYHQLTMQDLACLDESINVAADNDSLSPSRSASEVLSPILSSPRTASTSNSPHSPNSVVEPDSSINAALALREEANDSGPYSSPQ
ncbi:hypothetical protein KSP39_PZI018629 [Platanthera zijinensis]|uniref:Uncharacterized protein n=1 Tax=Platanthera zijinensis TaxID=2320716 RepID=A0AAP0B3T4_9ASPA